MLPNCSLLELPITLNRENCGLFVLQCQDLKAQIKQLTAEVAKLSPCDHHGQIKSLEAATCKQGNTHVHNEFHSGTAGIHKALNKNSFHLVYQPRKIALTIRGRHGFVPSWLSVSRAKSHLSAVLKFKYSEIDLHEIEILSAQYQSQRVILSFASR